MWGLVKGVLGIGGAVSNQKNIDHIASGIDKLFFTQEEKSDANMKILELQLDFVKSQKDENSIRSKARRVLAIMIVGNFLALLNAAVILYRIDLEYAKFIKETALTLSTAVTAVIIFYFGVHLLRSLKK